MQSQKQIFSRITALITDDLRNCRMALCVLAVYFITTQLLFGTVCPFAILTGLPCPACGLTRAFGALVTGQFEAAWQYNATIYLWIPLIIYGICYRYVLEKKSAIAKAFPVVVTIIVSLVTIIYYFVRLVQGDLPEVPFEGILVWLSDFLL